MNLLRFFKNNDLRPGDIRLSSSSLLTANQIKSSQMPFSGGRGKSVYMSTYLPEQTQLTFGVVKRWAESKSNTYYLVSYSQRCLVGT